MSYFQCEHGKVYYPFGRHSNAREELVAAVNRGPGQTSVSSSSSLGVQIHSFPLTETMAAGEDTLDTAATTAAPTGHSFTPLVLRDPSGPCAQLFAALASDVLRQIAHRMASATQVRILPFL